MSAPWPVALIVAAYLVAGVPWSVVLGKMLKGVDVRAYGSGATGATNSLRVLGWRISVVVFMLDFSKGLVPIVVGRWLEFPNWAIALVAVVSVVGHCWSPYIGFKGGKGMATGGGSAVGLFPWLFLLLLLIVAVVWRTRYVSLGSVLSAFIGSTLVFLVWLFDGVPGWWVLAIFAISGIIIWQHRGNIDRLRNGTERKFGMPESPLMSH